MEEVNGLNLQLSIENQKWSFSIKGMLQPAGSEAAQQQNQVEELEALQQGETSTFIKF